MRIVAVTNEKGGSGKSTLAISLACALHREGARVVLVDTDPQGTARDWRDAAPSEISLPPVVPLDRPEVFATAIRSLAADIAIVDTPARASRMAASVVRFAHAALIPLQPSGADVWASAATVKLIRAKQDVGGAIEAGFVATRVSGSTNLSRQILAGEWNAYGLPLLENCLTNRVSYAHSLTGGVSVFETLDRTARAEVELLVQELRKLQWL